MHGMNIRFVPRLPPQTSHGAAKVPPQQNVLPIGGGNVAGTGRAAKRACNFGQGCTRPDCYFAHPEGRHIDGGMHKLNASAGGFFAAPQSNVQSQPPRIRPPGHQQPTAEMVIWISIYISQRFLKSKPSSWTACIYLQHALWFLIF